MSYDSKSRITIMVQYVQLNPARADPRRTESILLQMLSQSPNFFLFHCKLEDSVQTGPVCNANFGLTGKIFANFG